MELILSTDLIRFQMREIMVKIERSNKKDLKRVQVTNIKIEEV